MTTPTAYTQPVVLQGQAVRLEPLQPHHLAALREVAFDPDLWAWTTSRIATEADLQRYVYAALREHDAGQALPFVLVEPHTERVMGSTRLGNMAPDHRRAEIGWTWVARPWQRSRVNTEAKRLLLGHAFDTLGCLRVEFKTDVLNARSRRAIERLGAVQEGVLRQHVITAAGRVRDTVYYSILADEWPGVRDALDARLAAR